MRHSVTLAVLLLTVLVATPIRAKAPLHVDDDGSQWPGAYTTINAALDDAGVGDTVLVHEGVYPEVYVFTDRITVRAIGDVVLDAEVAGPSAFAGIMVLAGVSGVTIQGFDIRNFTQGIAVLDGANDIVIKDNKVTETGAGIVLWYAATVTVVGNEVSRSSGPGIVVAANDNKVRENRVSGSGENGIVLFDTAGGNEVVGNVVTGSGGFGITLTNLTTNNVIKGNQVTTSGLTHTTWRHGINIAGHDNEIKDNDVFDSREDGIAIRGDRNLVADNSVLLSGRYGISTLYRITNDNMIRDNMAFASSYFDLCDDGWGTGNVWRDNRYNTANF